MHCCRRRVYACVFVYGWGECGFEKKTDDGSGEFCSRIADERGWETTEFLALTPFILVLFDTAWLLEVDVVLHKHVQVDVVFIAP